MNDQDTIYALATARGRAGVAVVRVSGLAAGQVVEALAGRCPLPRQASLRVLRHPKTGAELDQALVLWFPAPSSFTGENVVEFHIHGGLAVGRAVLDAIAAVSGTRPAEAGEFTRRAFHNGRLDLTAVEGLADLIAAETESQRRQALRQTQGRMAEFFNGWRQRLISALAYVEVGIDFTDEELPENVMANARPEVAALLAEIEAALADQGRGERMRDGLEVAIIGPPNAGKSSLLNALARREVAIVSSHAGTTRDVIEVHLDLGGYAVTLVDTAGLRDAGDEIEAEGIRRASTRAEMADVRLLLIPAVDWPQVPEAVARLAHLPNTWRVISRADEKPGVDGALRLSVKTGEGMDDLIRRLQAQAVESMGTGESVLITRARHREALTRASGHLTAFLNQDWTGREELAAEELRLAARALSSLTGLVGVEDVLGAIFSEFCIGK